MMGSGGSGRAASGCRFRLHPERHVGDTTLSRSRDIEARQTVRAASGRCRAISTLRRPLESVDLTTREPLAAYERSDVCVVPAAYPLPGTLGPRRGVVGPNLQAIRPWQAVQPAIAGM